MATTNDLMPRVEKGAAWLDEKRPTWPSLINFNRLRLHSCSQCVLGQCFGSYWAVIDLEDKPFGIHGAEQNGVSPWAIAHGFAVDCDFDNGDGWSEWGVLRECWITVILARRAKAAQVPAEALVTVEA